MRCVCVGVSKTAFSFDTLFSYKIPDELHIEAGMRVVVPFGKGDRRRLGIVTEVYDTDDLISLKEVAAVIDSKPFLSPEQISLLTYLHDSTMCTYYEAFRALFPPSFGMELEHTWRLKKRPAKGECSDKAMRLYLSAQQAESTDEAMDLLASDKTGLHELVEKGFVEENEQVHQRIRDKTVTMIRLCDGYENKTLTPKQEKTVRTLEQNEAVSVKELCYLAGCTDSVIKKLVSAGVCSLYEVESITAPTKTADHSPQDVVLNSGQQKVYDGITELINANKPATSVLQGVTGSGKTLVFVKLIEYTLSIGRNAIVLIPEISLTPQAVERFTGLFGETVAVMHSGLSLSQRANEYKRIKEGHCRIVVGTRSAIFSPLENIGLIIIDEEGERTYKSEKNPRYSAKDCAVFRCAYHNAVLLMASATPSVESYYNALHGKTRLFELTERFNSVIPSVKIVDTTGLRRNFSDELITAVKKRISKGEQSIILLNRRGYNTYAKCSECGSTITCPNCSISLTYHKANRLLNCHYCGHSEPLNVICPECGKSSISLSGAGTQLIEEEMAQYFPDARILRMDADTTYSRFSYEKQFTAFRNGEYDIMVGTQMIAKGLDFPLVTLVGVIGIDRALSTGDFRSYERTFSLITQVVGRSGRADRPGQALIQTTQPDHYIIELGAKQDYKGFYEQEIAIRRTMLYPPFCDICVVGISSVTEKEAATAANIFEALLREAHSGAEKIPLVIYRATKCDMERVCGQYRYKIMLKCKNDRRFREFISNVRRDALKMKEFSDVNMYVDINGDIP